MRKISGISGLRQFFARGMPVAALCSLAFAPSALAAVSLEKVELIHQHRTCTVTTKEPIYNERRSVTCGVESETRYTESSCPVERFRNCADPSHGVAYWEDATASPGSYTTRWEDGYLSVDGCMQKGEQWIANGSRGVKPPGDGYRHKLLEVEWEGSDTRAPITGGRVKASHRCTYKFGFDRAIYASSRSAACGVESHQACRTRTVYNVCRDRSFGIESYKQETGAFAACGWRVERGYITVVHDGEVIGKPLFAPAITTAVKVRADCSEVADDSGKHRCLRVHRAAVALAEPPSTAFAAGVLESLAKPLDRLADEAMLRALSAGDARGAYARMAATYAEERFATGVAGIKRFSDEARLAAQRLPDDVYFALALRLATQALTAAPLPGVSEDSSAYYAPLYALITDVELSGRRVTSRAIADLLVLLRAADPKASARARGQVFALNEFLARMAASYVDGRAHDIAQLQADAAQARGDALKVDAAVAAVSRRVREMKLRPAVEESALQQLQAVNASAQLQSTIRDLARTARSDAQSTMASVASYMQERADRDGLLKANLASVHLMRGNVNQALLQLRESGVEFNRVPKAEDRASSLGETFTRLRRNFATSVRSTLARSKATLERLRSGSELSIGMLSAASGPEMIPFELVDALMELNVAVGDKLDGIRLQLINRIATDVVDPLQEADAELSK